MRKILLVLILLISIFNINTVKADDNGITINDGEATLIDLGKINGDIHISSQGLKIYSNTIDADSTDSLESKLNSDGYYFKGQTKNYSITVDYGVTTSITFENVTISSSYVYSSDDLSYGTSKAKDYASCVNVSGANVTLYLKGTNTLIYNSKVSISGNSSNGACLEKSGFDGVLKIYSVDGSSDNSLICVASGINDTAIGCAYATVSKNVSEGSYESLLDSGASNIIIESGTIKATSGMYSAGIGSCNQADATSITINGGVVESTGGAYGAGIGSGNSGAVSEIYIKGGSVTAVGGYNAPGIGSGGSDYPPIGPKDAFNIYIKGTNTYVSALGNNTNAIGSGYMDESGNSIWTSKEYETIKKGAEYNIDVTPTNDSSSVEFKGGDDKASAQVMNLAYGDISAVDNKYLEITIKTEIYKITFDYLMDSIENKTVSVSKGTVFNFDLFNEDVDGYTLEGWYYDTNFENKVDNAVYQDETYYAKWNKINTVKFKYNYGIEDEVVVFSSDSEIEIQDGDKLTKPSNPTCSGYTFNGWYLDEELTEAYDFNTVITSDNMPSILYASWTKIIKTYTVEFVCDDNFVVTVNEGELVEKPDDPLKSGYKFIGWYKTSEYKELFNFDNPITADLKIYACFEKNKIDSNYLIAGGLIIASVILMFVLFRKKK